MHISKEGDPYLRTLLVQGAQHILGPFVILWRRWHADDGESANGRNLIPDHVATCPYNTEAVEPPAEEVVNAL